MKMQRIGILSSGGDAPGINPCIRAAVRTALYHGLEVLGIEEGFEGLIHGDMRSLRARDVSGIMQQGGTFLRTARCLEFKESKVQRKGLRELNEREIDGLLVIGGDGSMRGAHALAALGFPVMGAPSSIDNDILGTDMSMGVDTALNTIMDSIDKLRDTASSHQRVFLVETMGRNCGYLALISGVIGGAELIMIPERDLKMETIVAEIEGAYARGKTHAIIVAAEGASLKVNDVASFLKEHEVGFEPRVTILGHVIRGGSPSAFDRMLGTRMGVRAVEGLLDGKKDVMVGLQGRKIEYVPLENVIATPRQPNMDYYDMAEMLAR